MKRPQLSQFLKSSIFQNEYLKYIILFSNLILINSFQSLSLEEQIHEFTSLSENIETYPDVFFLII